MGLPTWAIRSRDSPGNETGANALAREKEHECIASAETPQILKITTWN